MLLAAEASGARAASSRSTSTSTPGEVVGLAGLLGSGRTELARLLFGADRADSGDGDDRRQRQQLRTPRAAVATGIAFCSENRKAEGIVGDLTVRENIVLALQAPAAGRGRCRAAARTSSPRSTSRRSTSAPPTRTP